MVRSWGRYKLGYSPDGLVGKDGLVEVKSRRQKAQVLTVVSGEVPAANMAQLQAGLFVSGRDWIDYISFSGGMHLFPIRVYPGPEMVRSHRPGRGGVRGRRDRDGHQIQRSNRRPPNDRADRNGDVRMSTEQHHFKFSINWRAGKRLCGECGTTYDNGDHLLVDRLKPRTHYVCPSGGVMGHKSIHTGSYNVPELRSPTDHLCPCGLELVEEDDEQWQLSFETQTPLDPEWHRSRSCDPSTLRTSNTRVFSPSLIKVSRSATSRSGNSRRCDMDMTETVVPKSDQLNADDLMSGPRTFTVAEVRIREGEQPVAVKLAEFPDARPFYPCKSMRRVMIMGWGADANKYAGRRLTLYRDPAVRFGGLDVGGIRISHMSHLDKPLTVALTVTRGKRAPYKVQPLPDAAQTSPVVSTETLDELIGLFIRKGIPEDAQLAGVNRIIGGHATDLEVITEHEARRVIEALQNRPDVDVPTPEPSEHAKATQAAAEASWGES